MAQPVPDIKKIPIDQLDTERIVVREVDQIAVDDYAASMKAGDKFPPCDVFEDETGTLILVNGRHRVSAALIAGLLEIDVIVHFGTYSDALKFAVAANVKNGVRLTNKDKRRAVTLLLKDHACRDLSDRAIAALTGVTHPIVGKIRKEIQEVDVRDAVPNSSESTNQTQQENDEKIQSDSLDLLSVEPAVPSCPQSLRLVAEVAADVDRAPTSPIEQVKDTEKLAIETAPKIRVVNFTTEGVEDVQMLLLESNRPCVDLKEVAKFASEKLNDGSVIGVITTVAGVGDLLQAGLSWAQPLNFFHLCSSIDVRDIGTEKTNGIQNRWRPIVILKKSPSVKIPRNRVGDVLRTAMDGANICEELAGWFGREKTAILDLRVKP